MELTSELVGAVELQVGTPDGLDLRNQGLVAMGHALPVEIILSEDSGRIAPR
jgi:hypothetical protein